VYPQFILILELNLHRYFSIYCYSLRPILLFANMDVSITKICLDTSTLARSIIGQREYEIFCDLQCGGGASPSISHRPVLNKISGTGFQDTLGSPADRVPDPRYMFSFFLVRRYMFSVYQDLLDCSKLAGA
jgi:hypothetical protein